MIYTYTNEYTKDGDEFVTTGINFFSESHGLVLWATEDDLYQNGYFRVIMALNEEGEAPIADGVYELDGKMVWLRHEP